VSGRIVWRFRVAPSRISPITRTGDAQPQTILPDTFSGLLFRPLDMFRHDDVGPEIKHPTPSCVVTSLDEPKSRAITAKQPKSMIARERQLVGVPGFVECGASLAYPAVRFSHTESVHVRVDSVIMGVELPRPRSPAVSSTNNPHV